MILANGGIAVQSNNITILESAEAVYEFSGLAHDCYADIEDTAATIYYNGAVVASGTFAAQSWSLSPLTIYIGSHFTISAQRWPGSIQLVEILDLSPGNTANSIRLLMDESVDVATYANSYPGTTAAATAAKNTGAGYPWVCAVVSHDGAGRPWTGSPSALVYSARRNSTVQTIDGSTGTFHALTFNLESLDPTSSLNLAVGWTAPASGIAEFGLGGSFAGSIADDITVFVLRTGGEAGTQTLSLPVTSRLAFGFTCSVAVNAGETWYPAIDGVAAGNTALQHLHSNFVIRFTPTATTL